MAVPFSGTVGVALPSVSSCDDVVAFVGKSDVGKDGLESRQIGLDRLDRFRTPRRGFPHNKNNYSIQTHVGISCLNGSLEL